jgi:hypothetical protein
VNAAAVRWPTWRKTVGPFELTWSRSNGFRIKLRVWGK